MDDNQQINIVYSACLIIAGLVFCFFGYRLLRLILAVSGFITGAVVSSAVVFRYTDGQTILTALAGFTGGVLGAGLMLLLFSAGVFLLGALLGMMLLLIACSAVGTEPPSAVIPLAAVAGGAISVLLRKFMIITATSFLGAWSVVSGAMLLFIRGFNPLDPYSLSSLPETALFRAIVIWAALGMAGFAAQYMTVPKKIVITDESTLEEAEKKAR